MGFPGVSVVKNLLANAGATKDAGSISGWGRTPGEGNGNPLQYSCLGNPMERSLAGYSAWSHKELDTTERLSTQCSPTGVSTERSTQRLLSTALAVTI